MKINTSDLMSNPFLILPFGGDWTVDFYSIYLFRDKIL